jgi:hypothetical protein
VSIAADLNFPCVLSTVWGMSSWLIQVTCVPAFTETTPGVNAKLSIITSVAKPPLMLPEKRASLRRLQVVKPKMPLRREAS